MAFDGKFLNPVAGQTGRLNQWNYGGIDDPDSPAYGDLITDMDVSGYFDAAVNYGLRIGDVLFLRDIDTNATGVRFVNIVGTTVSTANLVAKV